MINAIKTKKKSSQWKYSERRLILNGASRKGFSEDMTFRYRFEFRKEVDYENIWRKSSPGRGTSSLKALRPGQAFLA